MLHPPSNGSWINLLHTQHVSDVVPQIMVSVRKEKLNSPPRMLIQYTMIGTRMNCQHASVQRIMRSRTWSIAAGWVAFMAITGIVDY